METPRPGFRWFILVALVLATMTNAVTLISPAPMIGDLCKSLQTEPGAVVGATMGTFNLFGALAAIAGGWLLDRLGFVKVWIVCLTLMVIGLLLTPVFGHSILGLAVLRSLQAIGGGPIMASAGKVAAEWFVPEERGNVTAAQGFSMGIGITLGFSIAPAFLMKTGDPMKAMAAVSIVGIIALVLAIVVAFGPKAPEMAQPELVAGNSDNLFAWAMKQPATWMTMVVVVALGWLFQGYNDIVPGYIAIPGIGLGMGPMTAGKYMSMVSIALMVGAAVSGFLVEKVFGGSSRLVAGLACLLFAVFAFAIKFPAITGSSALVPCLVLAGFFMAVINPVLMAFFAKNYPEQVVGRICGTAQGISMFAGTAGVAAGASALHVTGHYQWPINIVVILGIIGAIAAFGMRKPGEVKVASQIEA